MKKVRISCQEWEHPEYGTLTAMWDETEPGSPRLVAIQPGLWVPAQEVAELVRLAREEMARKLQVGRVTEGDRAPGGTCA